ncbi:MAG TPA: hypothetical protein VIL31_04675 [Cyclobacteriaceae bacterium]|jgi:hypothetical protein
MVRFPGPVLCVIAFVLAPCFVWAQLQQTERYEKEFKYSDGVFSIISLGEEGIFLIRDRDKFEGGKKIWEAIHLDANLKEKKTISLPMETRNRLIGYERSPGQVLLLYRQGDTEKNNIEMIEVNLYGDEHPRHVVKPELAMSFTHFTRVGNSAILGGYVNREPSVLLYELGAKSMKIIPGFFQKDSELVDLRVNVNNTFNIVLIERSQRDERRVVFQTYDEKGQLLLEDVVTLDDRRTLQAGLTSMLVREDLILLGTWGEGNAKQSNGFFAMPIDPFQDQKIKYTAFGELNHYLDYMKENRARRIRENTQQVVSAGGIPNFINYVMPYRIQEYEGGFLLFAEAYSPSSTFSDFARPYGPYYYSPYYSPYGWYYPGYGRLYSRPYSYGYRSRNEEIKTYQSMVISFAPDGTVQWDHSLQLDDVRRGGLEQVADFHYMNGHLIFLEKDESEIKARWILPEDGEDDETVTQKILLPNPDDEIRSEKEEEGGIQYWYGNTFFVWGYHTIRNNTMKERVREVFYINKVEVN